MSVCGRFDPNGRLCFRGQWSRSGRHAAALRRKQRGRRRDIRPRLRSRRRQLRRIWRVSRRNPRGEEPRRPSSLQMIPSFVFVGHPHVEDGVQLCLKTVATCRREPSRHLRAFLNMAVFNDVTRFYRTSPAHGMFVENPSWQLPAVAL